MLLIFLVTIITFWNTLWYFHGGQLFRSEQSYRMRELLSSVYKVIVYLFPTLILFRSTRKQSRRIFWDRKRWPLTLIFLVVFLAGKQISSSYQSFNPHVTLLTYWYVLFSNSIIEEWVFRWIIFDTLRTYSSFLITNSIQAICFGLVHIPLYIWMWRSWLSLLGAIGGVICLWFRRGRVKKDTKGLFYPTVLHSIWNGVLIFV